MGDFIIHMDDLEDVDSCLLHDKINAFNLKQQVNIPMHNLGHILDLIITENLQEYGVEKIIPGPYLSDHQFTTIQLTECKPEAQQLLTKHRRIPTDIMQGFNRHFSNQSELETTDLDKVIDKFQNELQRTLDQIAPEKLLKSRNRNKKPWFDKELYDQRRMMKNREWVWLKYQNAIQWKAYTRERNRFNTILKFKKFHSLHTLILENKHDTKNYTKSSTIWSVEKPRIQCHPTKLMRSWQVNLPTIFWKKLRRLDQNSPPQSHKLLRHIILQHYRDSPHSLKTSYTR